MSVSVTTAGDHVIVVQVFPKGEEPANLQPIDSKSEHKPLVEPESKSPKEENTYPASQQKSLGIIQIMTGLLTAALGVTLLFIGIPLLLAPMWTAAVYIISGALCVSVGAPKGNRPCLLKGTLAMNIICALMAVTGIVVTCLGLAITVTSDRYSSDVDYESSSYSNMYWDYQGMRRRFQTAKYGILGLLLVLAVLEFCVAFAASVLAHRAIRRSSGGMQSDVTVPIAANLVFTGYSDVKPLLNDVPSCPPPAYDA
ncbi:membrane-spanning 4-domains subfamily A member 4A-like [Brienomyrus brachyistius]|uniref:membrane-spanning 4-domains subfamily A member 4A-like n=1 Tax=Brienomyrus brachyistius TaxID=42636 RepID=UPI0020B268B3|nr:membrane-spanning 4-domains subfamily A member 4A-like [Brienomyrus brachyistius]XP_048849708.1 membrane-spanning 4-domains subfamily A member 4A-like [Brienomyrus brachyistius]